MSELILKGLKVHFNLLECMVRANNNEMLAIASLESNLYKLYMNVINETETNYLHILMETSYLLWHTNLGHLYGRIVKIIQNMASGMDVKTMQGMCMWEDAANFSHVRV